MCRFPCPSIYHVRHHLHNTHYSVQTCRFHCPSIYLTLIRHHLHNTHYSVLTCRFHCPSIYLVRHHPHNIHYSVLMCRFHCPSIYLVRHHPHNTHYSVLTQMQTPLPDYVRCQASFAVMGWPVLHTDVGIFLSWTVMNLLCVFCIFVGFSCLIFILFFSICSKALCFCILNVGVVCLVHLKADEGPPDVWRWVSLMLGFGPLFFSSSASCWITWTGKYSKSQDMSD